MVAADVGVGRRRPGQPDAEVDRRFFAIATDLVGAPTELVDPSGDIAWRSRTTLWGATAWPRTSTAYTPLRFPGQYDDPETGLHYNFFRHYDPEAARYVSPDAVYQSQGQRGNLTFRQGEDVVITKGPGAGGGDVIAAYGPSGRAEPGRSAARPTTRACP